MIISCRVVQRRPPKKAVWGGGVTGLDGSSHTHKSRTQPRRLLVVTFGVLAPTAVSIRSIFQGSRHAEKLINTHSSGIDKWNYIWGCRAGYGEAQQFKVCFSFFCTFLSKLVVFVFAFLCRKSFRKHDGIL